MRGVGHANLIGVCARGRTNLVSDGVSEASPQTDAQTIARRDQDGCPILGCTDDTVGPSGCNTVAKTGGGSDLRVECHRGSMYATPEIRVIAIVEGGPSQIMRIGAWMGVDLRLGGNNIRIRDIKLFRLAIVCSSTRSSLNRDNGNVVQPHVLPLRAGTFTLRRRGGCNRELGDLMADWLQKGWPIAMYVGGSGLRSDRCGFMRGGWYSVPRVLACGHPWGASRGQNIHFPQT